MIQKIFANKIDDIFKKIDFFDFFENGRHFVILQFFYFPNIF